MMKATKITILFSLAAMVGHRAKGNIVNQTWSRGIVPLLVWMSLGPIVGAGDALSQSVPTGASGSGTCSFEEDVAFAPRSTSTIGITAKFIARPGPDAEEKKIRTRFIYMDVLGLIIALRLTGDVPVLVRV